VQGRNLDTELNALKNNLPPPKKKPDFLWKHRILDSWELALQNDVLLFPEAAKALDIHAARMTIDKVMYEQDDIWRYDHRVKS